MECAELYAVLDRRVSGQDANREVLADVLNPAALANRTEPQGDCFVEAFGCDLGGVLDSLSIADRDAAGTDRHNARVACFALASPDGQGCSLGNSKYMAGW